MTVYLPLNHSPRQVQERVNYLVNLTMPSNRPIINVIDLGVKGDGTDETALIQHIIDNHLGKTLYFPSGRYAVGNLRIYQPCSIIGDTTFDELHSAVASTYLNGTVFIPAPGTTGYLFNIGLENDPPTSSTVRSWENQIWGIYIDKIGFDGLSRGVDVGAIKCRRLDHSEIKNVAMIEFAREAIKLESGCRETVFRNIVTRWCGDKGNNYPAINFSDNGTVSDSHNNIWFLDSHIDFTLGDSVYIDSHHVTSYSRRLHFINCLFHGLVPAYDGVKYTYTTAQKAFNLAVVRGGQDIKFIACRFQAAGLDTPNVVVDTATNGNIPETVMFTNCEFNEHYSGSVSRIGLDVNTGSVILTSNVFRGHNEGSWDVAVGATVYDHGNVILTGGAPVINGTGYLLMNSDVRINSTRKLLTTKIQPTTGSNLDIMDELGGLVARILSSDDLWYFIKDTWFDQNLITRAGKYIQAAQLRPPAATAMEFQDDTGTAAASVDATTDLFRVQSSNYNGKHLQFGGDRVWKDDLGIWRTKTSAPAGARDGVAFQDNYSALSIATTGTSDVDYLGANVLIFSPASALTSTNFTTTYQNNGKTLWCRFANGNTTIQHNSNVILRGAVDVTPAPNNTMLFKRIEGVWYEFSRNF